MAFCPHHAAGAPEIPPDLEMLSRRRWLRSFVMGSAAVVGGAGTVSRLLAEISPGVPASNIVRFPLSSFPALLKDFGSVRLSLFSSSLPGGLLTVNRAAGGVFYVVSPICTHQGCVVRAYDHSPATRAMVCDCHGSVFDIQGKITSPVVANQANLTSFNSTLSNGVLQVEIPDLNFKINSLSQQSVSGETRRFALSFPTRQGARYRVKHSPDLAAAPVTIPFFTTATGTTSMTQLTQSAATPNPRTVYVDATAAKGFYFIELVITEYNG